MGIFDDLDEMPSHSTPRRETTLDARETTNAAHDPEGTHREVCTKCSGSGRTMNPPPDREHALQFLRDLARDMQTATTSHVRRQGRRLAKALQAVEMDR